MSFVLNPNYLFRWVRWEEGINAWKVEVIRRPSPLSDDFLFPPEMQDRGLDLSFDICSRDVIKAAFGYPR